MPMPSATNVVVKTDCDGDVRRFAHQDGQTLEHLKHLVQTSYGLDKSSFTLRYVDGTRDTGCMFQSIDTSSRPPVLSTRIP